MLQNYLVVALRTLRRQPGYAFLNVTGLAVGMACFLLIALYLRDELSYDRFHPEAGRLFRVYAEAGSGGEMWKEASASSAYPTGPVLEAAFPEVEATVRLRRAFQAVVRVGERRFSEGGFYFADPRALEVFGFPLLRGDVRTALARPNTVVLTERAAQKYFGDANPVGQVLSYNGWQGPLELTVTGVLRDLPTNTHFAFDFLSPLSPLAIDPRDTGWTSFSSLWTYVRLSEGASVAAFEAKLPAFVEATVRGTLKAGDVYRLRLEPVTGIHLRSALSTQMKANGSIVYVYTFACIAAIILLLACINFMSLATARAMRRSKEVGMRKALGAHRGQLVVQFLSEAVLMSAVAVVLSTVLAALLLPTVNGLSGKALRLGLPGDLWVVLVLAATTLGVGLIAGTYPAFFLSGFRPVEVLRGRFTTGAAGARLRAGLVVFQFAVSIALIAGTVVVYRQLAYVQAKDLGLDREQVVVLPATPDVARLREQLMQQPGVLSISGSSRVPVNDRSFDDRPVIPEGAQASVQLENYIIDADFLRTYRISLVAGRDLEPGSVRDSSAFLINEAAVQQFGWGTPQAAIGRRLSWSNGQKQGEVIGVVKDFHLGSLHEAIKPLVLHRMPEAWWYDFVSVRLAPGTTTAVLPTVERAWRALTPEGGYEAFFLDDSFAQLHAADTRFGRVFGYFAGLSIFIACLGLFGLAAYAAERRTKEIGVRKVLGASVGQLVALLSGEFVRLVLAASVVAVPLAYAGMSRWLEGFAYRTPLGPGVFVAAGALALFIALATVSTQALRTATADPVRSLRTE